MILLSNLVKRLSTSDTQMLDLDPSFAVVETVPLVNVHHTDDILSKLLHKSERAEEESAD